MRSKNSQVFLLYLAAFVTILGFGMVFPLLPFYAQEFGASPAQIGLLAASFSIFQFLASPLVGRISDRFGRKPVLAASLFGTAVSFFVLSTAGSLSGILFSRILHGISSSGAFPIASAYIGDISSRKERIVLMGRLAAVFSLGFVFGPAFSGILADKNPTLPFLLAGIIAILNFLFIILFLPESIKKKEEELVIREGLINISAIMRGIKGEFGALFLLLFGWSFAVSNFSVALPLFGEEKFSFSGVETSYVFVVTGAVAAFMQFFVLPKVARIIGEHRTVSFGVICMSIGQFLIGFSGSPLLLYLFTSVSVIGGSLLRPTINTILSKETHGGQGTTMGTAFSFESLGRIAGPLIAGGLISTIGTQGQFVITAVILMSGFAFFFKKHHINDI